MALLGKDDISKINDDIKTKEVELDSKKEKEESINKARAEKKARIDQFNGELSEMAADETKKLAQKQDLEVRIAKQTQTLEELEKQKASLSEQEDQNLQALEETRASLENKEDILDQRKTEAEKLDEEVTDLTKSIEEIDLGIAEDTERLAKLENEKANEEEEAVKEKLQAEIDDLTKAKEDREKKKAAETEKKNTKAAEKAAKDAEIATSKSEVESLQNSADAIMVTLKSIKSSKEELGESVNEAEEERENLARANDDVERDLSNIEGSRKEVKDSLAEESKQLKSLDDNYSENKDSIKKLMSDLEELRSGELIKRHDLEKENRIEHVNITIKNKERLTALVNNKDNERVLERANKDSNIFIDDIKEALNIESTEVIRDAIEDARNKYEEGKTGKQIYRADEAFRASRLALVDINLSGINEKIHKSIQKGLTSITVTEDQISGIEILALTQLGYRVTHKPIANPPGRLPVELTIVIDWGFAGGGA